MTALVERTEGEARAYFQGYEAGVAQAIRNPEVAARVVEAMRAVQEHAPSRPETESAAPVSEAHVQHATVSEALMDAMCMGRWRIGPIIFGTNGHGEFRSWAILAPWPWLRDGEDTPHAAIARFQAKNPPTPTQLNHARAARLADEICASPPAETGEGAKA